jgi:1,4-alpha-glucan branching enzyme
MYPYQHDAERRMSELAKRFSGRDEKTDRVLNQLARELLLAQSSDWAFQIYKGTTVEYSSRRFQSHIQRFDLLAKMLESGEIDEALLKEIEHRDNIFAEVDHRVYLP